MKKNILSLFIFIILVLPASTNYQLKDYSFGSGGIGNSTSAGYSMNAISGEIGTGKETGTNYGIGLGLNYTNQANVPVAPIFDNPNGYYNRLRLIINPSGNPSSAKFAVAISDDNFVTAKYVQNDNTIGDNLGPEDYQTYSSWGGASGIYVIGLSPGTTYVVKVKAITGKFTETSFGPNSSAATVNPTLSLDIDVAANDSETNPPYGVNFGSLISGAVNDSAEKVWVDFSTNAEAGGKVYVSGANGGLKSSSNGHTISSITGNLAVFLEGFGAQAESATQSSGGPLAASALYDQTGDNVGIIDQSMREIFTSSYSVIGGRGSFVLKAKSSNITPAASDYSEVFTVVAASNF
ncbi:MAG TPA: hypothetical protein DIC35_04110 [Candidatus Moranbacteria bacterium]|nr:hypothetical protein [Candidatus Moranbacteria bacterium]